MLFYGVNFPALLPICSIVKDIKKLNKYDKFSAIIEAFIVINFPISLILIAPLAVNECASIKWFEFGDYCHRL